LRVAFVAATPVAGRGVPRFGARVAHFRWQDTRRLVRAVQQARAAADRVVVSLHWGMEGARGPGAAHRALARSLVEAGASVIAGHGAHRAQGSERVGRAWVFWDLGDALRPGAEGAGVRVVSLEE
jgi:poly-gamma-glutamate capsule biosynthesis protein CapA/YwtB (metallophosphatase superfamily)